MIGNEIENNNFLQIKTSSVGICLTEDKKIHKYRIQDDAESILTKAAIKLQASACLLHFIH